MGKAVRMISDDGTLSVMAIDSTDIVEMAHFLHGTVGVTSAALGRLLTAASMMGAVLKGENQSVTLRINGGGPAGAVVAVADSKGNVKGYIGNPLADVPLNDKGKLDVAKVVGKEGTLTVMKDLNLKEPYVGQIPLVSGEIAEDITAYFAMSEQTPTVCALGVLVNKENKHIITAGGFIIQLLPTADEGIIDRVENCIKDIQPVTTMLTMGLTPQEICREVLKGFNLELLDEFEPVYECKCNKERFARGLITLGKQELLEISKDSSTEVNCHFCNKKYIFSSDEITELIGDLA